MEDTGFGLYVGLKDNGGSQSSLPIDNIDMSSLKEQERIRYSQDTKFRKHLTRWVMWLIPLWLLSVLYILAKCASMEWYLSDVTLSTLLATTTINILGLANIVLRGMFPQKENKSK